MAGVIRAFVGYLFLILVVRVVGRRPGKQLTPLEFVLIFFIGGLGLTAIVGDERSFTNAICQIITIALTHFCINWARAKSNYIARLVDGTPLVLLEGDEWRTVTLSHMHVDHNDVLFAARDHGMDSLQAVERAVLERNGEITLFARSAEGQDT